MATVNFCGWETGIANAESTASSGTLSVQTSVVRSGTYGLRVNPTTTATGFQRYSGILASGLVSAVAYADLYCRVYFQYLTKPASSDEEICAVLTTGTALKLGVRLNSSGQLAVYDANNSLLATGTTVLASGVWYRVELHSATGASGATWEVRINGLTEISGTGNLSATNGAYFAVGKRVNSNGNTVDFYYDDLFISNSAFPGPGQCVVQVPSANGTDQNGTANGAATLWQCCKEIPNDTTTYVNGLSSGQACTFKLTASGVGQGTVNSVKSYVFCVRDGATNGNVKSRLRSGSQTADTTGAATAAGYSAYVQVNDTDPNTGASWTGAGVDAAESGVVENSANPDRMTVAYQMVDYNPALPVGSALSSSSAPQSSAVSAAPVSSAAPSSPTVSSAAPPSVLPSSPSSVAPISPVAPSSLAPTSSPAKASSVVSLGSPSPPSSAASSGASSPASSPPSVVVSSASGAPFSPAPSSPAVSSAAPLSSPSSAAPSGSAPSPSSAAPSSLGPFSSTVPSSPAASAAPVSSLAAPSSPRSSLAPSSPAVSSPAVPSSPASPVPSSGVSSPPSSRAPSPSSPISPAPSPAFSSALSALSSLAPPGSSPSVSISSVIPSPPTPGRVTIVDEATFVLAVVDRADFEAQLVDPCRFPLS